MAHPPDTPGFAALPHQRNAKGETRRVGVEIEFAGLSEHETADLAQTHLGGQAMDTGPHALVVKDTSIGNLEIMLDTALRKYGGNALVDAGLDAARGFVPVEIVTEPLTPADLPRLDAFAATLRDAGAMGTDDGALLGFGVHFNVEVTAPDDATTQTIILAFALAEDWLRQMMPIDTTRRLMPFVDPWPRAFLDALVAAGPGAAFSDVRETYARHCNSRNYALDLLPIYAFADDAAFKALFPKQTNTKGRPAFHYRLPDCRIDDKNWSLAHEWQRWWLVERLADAPDLLARLQQDYSDWTSRQRADRTAWADHVGSVLGEMGANLRDS